MYTLTETKTTSAGVFYANGSLSRTLWSNETRSAGTHIVSWDGLDDQGNTVTEPVIIKVVANNINWVWEAEIGNTSLDVTGVGKHRGYDIPQDLCFTPTHGYFCRGHVEGDHSGLKFNINTPNRKELAFYRPPWEGRNNQSTVLCVTDNTRTYWYGDDGWATDRENNYSPNFIYATVNADESMHTFADGQPYQAVTGYNYPSVINLNTVYDMRATAMAVQTGSTLNLLAISEGVNETGGRVRFYNKITGALLTTSTLSGVRTLQFRTEQLWIARKNDILYRGINQAGTWAASTVFKTGFQDILSMAISPDNSTIIVADGGSAQQVIAFNISTGAEIWRHGVAGGYLGTNANVSYDKFYFTDQAGIDLAGRNLFQGTRALNRTFVRFQGNASFWVLDTGNHRMLKFSVNNRTLQDEVMYQPHTWNVQRHKQNPNRIFISYLEFEIDYTKPLRESWTLVRNWGARIPGNYAQDSGGFTNISTYPNGRTYAFIRKGPMNEPNWEINDVQVVELATSNNIRLTGTIINQWRTNYFRYEVQQDGSLRAFANGFLNNEGTHKIRRYALSDNGENPNWNWGNPTVLVEVSDIDRQTDPVDWAALGKEEPGLQLSDGSFVSFDAYAPSSPESGSNGWHLGAINPDGTWKFKTSWVTHRAFKTENGNLVPDWDNSYSGNFPTDGRFDIGNRAQYHGGAVMVDGPHIIWNYHGEFWKNMQTNKYNQYHESGLMLCQFGVAGNEIWENGITYFDGQASPMMAGNTFSPCLTRVNGTLYLWHNDESYHGGAHRWRMENENSIEVFDIPYQR